MCIYVEDLNNEFLFFIGMLCFLCMLKENDVVCVDIGVVEGDEVSVFYDFMIVKFVVWGENCEIVFKCLISVLGDYYIDGVSINIDFLKCVVIYFVFVVVEFIIMFVEKYYDLLFSVISNDVVSDDI